MNPALKAAVTTLVQIIDLLTPGQLADALDEIDLTDEAFEEELQIVKKAIEQ